MNSAPTMGIQRHIALYLTQEQPCSYLEGLQSRSMFVDPHARVDSDVYQLLLDQGFRRSGAYFYRPACLLCQQCVPIRIPITTFHPDRAQRRTWKRNVADIGLVERPAEFDPEHFSLYQRYLDARHGDGSMAEDASEENYAHFLTDPWGGETRLLELRLAEQLVGVAVTDVLPHGLSAVYTFFDPTFGTRSLGTFAILSQIQWARRARKPYLYLGYWIRESRKMAYKARFRPCETWNGTHWRTLTEETSAQADSHLPETSCAHRQP